MVSELMPVRNHAPDDIGVSLHIFPDDKKRRAYSVLFKDRKNFVGILRVWSVVKSQRKLHIGVGI